MCMRSVHTVNMKSWRNQTNEFLSERRDDRRERTRIDNTMSNGKKRVDNVACGSWFIRLGIRGVTVCATYAYIHTTHGASYARNVVVYSYYYIQSTKYSPDDCVAYFCVHCNVLHVFRVLLFASIETLREPFQLDGVSVLFLSGVRCMQN